MPSLESVANDINQLLPEGETCLAGFFAKTTYPHDQFWLPRIVMVTTNGVRVFTGGVIKSWEPGTLIASLPFGEPIEYKQKLVTHRVNIEDQRLRVGLTQKKFLEHAAKVSRRERPVV